MSGFWVGVFAGLTVWKTLMVLTTFVLQGKTVTYGKRELTIEMATWFIFATATWYFATFGGGL